MIVMDSANLVSQELGNASKEDCCTVERGNLHECCFPSPSLWYAEKWQDVETTVTTARL